MFTAKPSVPKLLFPLNNDVGVTVLPVFSWFGSGAERFFVYLGTEPDLDYQNLIAEREGLTYESLRLGFGTTYYWKIEAANDGGTTSSETFSFTTTDDETAFSPTQPFALPVSAVQTASGYRCVFSWQCQSADQYDFYIGTTENPELFVSGLSDAAITIEDLFPKTTYFWKVVARNAFGETVSFIWEYETGELSPSVPTPVFPAQNAVDVALNINIVWTESLCPLGSGVEYELVFSENADFLISDRYEGLAQPSCRITALWPLTTYYWKVIAQSAYGSIESEIFGFTTRASSSQEWPEIPYAPHPANGAVNVGTSVTLSWHCEQAETYSIYMGFMEDALFLVESDLTSTVYPMAGLTYESLYYWKIVAVNAAGSSESPVWRFQTGRNDTEAPIVSSIETTMPYNPDRKVPLGSVTKLRAAIVVDDDVKLNAAEVRLYANKPDTTDWQLIAIKYTNLASFQTTAQWNSDYQIDTTTGSFFDSAGYYRTQVSVIAEDLSGNKSIETVSSEFEIQVVKGAGSAPDIEGTWIGTFNIAYIVYINDTIQLNVVKTGDNIFSITVSYDGKNYAGSGTIDSNGDLRITAKIEGVDVVLIGAFDSDSAVGGSAFVLREDETLTQIGVWHANKS